MTEDNEEKLVRTIGLPDRESHKGLAGIYEQPEKVDRVCVLGTSDWLAKVVSKAETANESGLGQQGHTTHS